MGLSTPERQALAGIEANLAGTAPELAATLRVYAFTRGRHDFLSRRSLVPARYLLLADAALADQARAQLHVRR